ncbi:hypothetical protein Tsubulata_027688 [Turnera subulata]|uniref:PWWP domain-containing protein n=1 Tax=Turnera subulata TaxID=218843 RepID=A0A9Q0F4B7_9ROSI|nr:hypothetical protein Tsubulata_027688 [Turnera subulata]
MGSSSSDDPNNNNSSDGGNLDASVGALVWVRRRNGSWWPGRIMGLDEISEASLVSPRSGTPVKLLGRDDASVDWYNFEKSKRVKAFRCGEYDECIEKAKASAASGNRKAVKYARREDAILHALEIENTLLGEGRLEFFPSANNLGEENGNSAKESPSMSTSGKEDEDVTDEGNNAEGDADADSDSRLNSESGSGSDSDLAPELSQSGISFEEPNCVGPPKVQSTQGKRRRTPNDSEDDGTEGIKRMRGLVDLGMGVGESNNWNCISNGSPVNGSKGCNSSLKRKRTQVANGHEFLKRKNRRRPLTKVLECTAMVPVRVICDQLPSSSGSPHQGLSNNKISGMDSNESKKNVRIVTNNNSDSTGISSEAGATLNPCDHVYDASHANGKLKKEKDISAVSGLPENRSSDRLFDVPFVPEAKRSKGFPPVGKHQIGGFGQQASQAEALSVKIEGHDEPGSTHPTTSYANISQRMEKGTSKWQLKRKRNSRHISKNRRQDSRKYVDMDDEPNACLAGIQQLDGYIQGSDQKVDCDDTRRSLPLYNCSVRVKTEDQVDGDQEWAKSVSHREPHRGGNMADVSVAPQRSLPYRQSRFTVNSRYRTAEFPARTFGSHSKLVDVKLEVKSNYRPQHVPLVSLMSKLNGKAIVGHPLTVELLNDGYCDTMINKNDPDSTTNSAFRETPELGSAGIQNLEAGRMPAKLKTTQPRSSHGKSNKSRKSGILSKKTRKLSSLTGGKREDKKPAVEKPKGPVIACIPLKLVFSRITEAVNCSARQTHRPCPLTSSDL